jgi:hypothetical protein
MELDLILGKIILFDIFKDRFNQNGKNLKQEKNNEGGKEKSLYIFLAKFPFL